MADEPSAVGDPELDRGPAMGEVDSEAVDSDGADDQGPETTQDAETASSDSPAHDTDAESSDDELIQALAGGKMDDLDGDGRKAKADAKPDASEDEPEATTDAEEGDKPETAEGDKTQDDEAAREKALLDKARTKAERKDIAKLFEERRKSLRPAKAFADGVVKHAMEAKLVSATDKGLDTSGLYNLIETEKRLQAMPPKEQAEHYRKLADQLYPQVPQQPPTPVALPQDLQDAVDAGYLKKDEAEAVATKRNPPKADEKKPETKQDAPEVSQGPKPEELQRGYKSVADVAKSYKERFPADWESMAAEVEKRLAPLIDGVPPKKWGDIAKEVVRAVAAERKPATKKPTPTTRPSSLPQKRSSDALSEEEELDALAKGRPI